MWHTAPSKASDSYFGTCGDDLSWVLSSAGTLSISGNGEMHDYLPSIRDIESGLLLPEWTAYAGYIDRVIIEEGVTSIGDYAFRGCMGLVEVNIPASVSRIGNHAFENCTSLVSVSLPDSVETLGDYAFPRH